MRDFPSWIADSQIRIRRPGDVIHCVAVNAFPLLARSNRGRSKPWCRGYAASLLLFNLSIFECAQKIGHRRGKSFATFISKSLPRARKICGWTRSSRPLAKIMRFGTWLNVFPMKRRQNYFGPVAVLWRKIGSGEHNRTPCVRYQIYQSLRP